MSETKHKILVIEDDPSIQLGLRMALEREGYVVGVAEDGEAGLEATSTSWDLIILDVMLPKLNGYDLLSQLRAGGNDTPVLILSAKTEEPDKVMGLDLGAEDYVTKPFSVPELMARVRAALRRGGTAPPTWAFGDVILDTGSRTVRRGDVAVELTATEYEVLDALVRHRGRTLTREQIFAAVWGPEHHGTYRTIDNFIAQLRHKLEDDPAAPKHLVTVRGIGYRLSR